MSDRLTSTASVQQLTTETTFNNFQSLTIIDAGQIDGFQIAGTNGVFGFIPGGFAFSIKGPYTLCEQITVKAATGKSLNVTVILYY